MSPVSFPRRTGLKRPVFITIATAAMTAFVMTTAGFAEAGPVDAGKAAPVLVQFKAPAAVGYTGGIAGIAATKPVPGTKLDTKSSNYKAYRDHIRAQRANTLRQAKVDTKKLVADLDTVVNGAIMKLTPAEAAKLSRTPDVVKVWPNETLKLLTTDTPNFIGLAGPTGAWAEQFGDVSRAGEGVIVGVIDTGFTPENPSFAALPEPRPDADIIADRWQGECVAGEEAPVTCNNKVIGARFYNTGQIPISDREFKSPRDFGGHGSHTASTAAGNHNVTAIINGENVGKISGIAPAARIAAYKVCWDDDGCDGLGIVKAIDDAVGDRVHVINYSISGATSTLTNLIQLAFLQAAAAGVFVSAAAGNTPGVSTVNHPMPWVATVAASTHDRTFSKSATLGSGTSFTAPGTGSALPPTTLVDSPTIAAAGAKPEDVRRCVLGSLDPAKTAGKIVVCERGGNARTEKSRAVQQAGGVGMILYNPSPNSLNADFHAVPSIHVGPAEGATIKTYIASAGAGATASMTAAVRQVAKAPQMASFSSAGPAIAADGDLLKPDITAPGVDVIAAVAPPGNFGNNFDAYSGTSMATPHVAGIAALLGGKFPTWTPMAIKSAMMTTANQTDNTGAPIQREGGAPASPLDYGAGHVRPRPAFNPGLVYDSGVLEWVQFICGAGENVVIGENGDNACDLVGSIDPSDLNYPSIAIGDLAGKQTITRTVSNTTNQASVYFPKLQVPAGFTVKATPPVLTVLPRRSATFKLEITRTTAAFNAYGFGSITWADLRGHSVRSPIALRPVAVAAPRELNLTGASGSSALSVRAGFDGALTAAPFGLVASTAHTNNLVGANTNFDAANPTTGPAVAKVDVTVPAGTKLARFATFASEYPAGADHDMYVYRGGKPVGTSAGGTSDEQVTVTQPGTYEIYVVQFSTGGPEALDVHLHSFLVPPTAAGNLTVTPASQPVKKAQVVTVNAGWSGLTAGQHYLGVIEYGEGPAAVGQTIIAVHA